MPRNKSQKIKDFIFFPLRAITLFEHDRWGLSALSSERFDYVSNEVCGYCLDVGCGKYNLFIEKYLQGKGKGIDVFQYKGLSSDHIVKDITKFPFGDATFDTVTFIGNINHVPASKRDIELLEAYRCLKHGGNIIVTMGNPVTEILVHKLVWLYDRLFGTNYDMDSERGMSEGEAYYLLDSEIMDRLFKAGFKDITRKKFLTQWFLNCLYVGWKK
jgi:SAM-dependent methyltransferase